MLRPCGFLHALVSRQLGSKTACSVFVGSLSRPLVSFFRRLRRPSRIYVPHVLRSRRLVLRFGADTHQFDAHVFFGGHVGACRSRPFVQTSASVRRAASMSRLTFHSFFSTCLRFASARPSPPISLFFSTRPTSTGPSFVFFFGGDLSRISLRFRRPTHRGRTLRRNLSRSSFPIDTCRRRAGPSLRRRRLGRLRQWPMSKGPTPSSDGMEKEQTQGEPGLPPVGSGFERETEPMGKGGGKDGGNREDRSWIVDGP